MRKNFIPSGIAIVLLFFLGFSCKGVHPTANFGKTAIGKEAMVVTAHPEATRVGLEVLANGGNAVDAMVAVQFALAEVYPSAGNIGGGGFMVIRVNTGEAYTLYLREKAPLSAYEAMYLDEEGEVVCGFILNVPRAAGVTGSVDGMIKAHQKFGKLPFKILIQPAIQLAQKGFVITEQQAGNYNSLRQTFINYNRDSLAIPLVKSDSWQQGDNLKQK